MTGRRIFVSGTLFTVAKIHDATLKAGKIPGGPQAWSNRRNFLFFQGATEASLIRAGAAAALGTAPAAGGRCGGAAPR